MKSKLKLALFALVFLSMAGGGFSTPSRAGENVGSPARAPASTATSQEVVVIAKIKFKKDGAMTKSFKKIASQLPQAVKEEPGCLQYGFYQSNDDPTLFASFERWESQEAFQTHMKTFGMKAFQAVVGPFLSEPPDIQLYENL